MDNVIGHLTATKFLLSVAVLLSASLQDAITHGDFTLDPTGLYIKKNVAGASGIYKLLDSNTKQLDGICSFDSDGKMDQNRAAVWNRLRIGYGVGAAAGDEGKIDYNTAIPKELLNADLVISQEGKQVLRDNVFNLIAKGTATKAGDDSIELPSLRLLRDDKNVEINLHFPSGVSLAAAGAGTTPYIFVSINGLVTRKK